MNKAEDYISSYKEFLSCPAGSELAEVIEEQLADLWEEMSPQEHLLVLTSLLDHA